MGASLIIQRLKREFDRLLNDLQAAEERAEESDHAGKEAVAHLHRFLIGNLIAVFIGDGDAGVRVHDFDRHGNVLAQLGELDARRRFGGRLNPQQHAVQIPGDRLPFAQIVRPAVSISE